MMKRGWEIYRIGDFCDVKTGKLDANASSADGTYPFFTCSKEPLRIETYSYDAECVLVAGNGDLNVKYYKGKFDAYQRTYIITLKEHIKNISVKYLYKFFLLYVETLRSKSIGGVIKYIKLGDITNAKIMIPPIVEQERIVGELDCLSGIIAAKRAQLRELDTLAQSIFYTMFGDPYNNVHKSDTLSNLSKCKLSYGSGASAVKYDNKIRYIRITDINEDGTLSENIVSPNVVDDKYLLQDGDLLFARSGATVGKTYLYDSKIGKSIYAGYLIRFVANTDVILPKYLYYYTKTEYYKSFIKSNTQAVAQPNINAQQYSKLIVVVPPLELQKQFAEKIENIERQKELITKSIKETEDLFNSRMSYYFD